MIGFFGVVLADDTVLPTPTPGAGLPVYERPVVPNTDPPVAYGFRLVVEGAPDPKLPNCQDSNAPDACTMGTSTYNTDGLPDLQIEASNNLGDGNGSTAICDDAHGVSAVTPFDFSPVQAPTINQFACRFRDGMGSYQGIVDSRDACTQVGSTGGYGFVQGTQSKIQFCGQMNQRLAYPVGDTILAVRIRDKAGDLSQVKQIVIRVPAP